jgi:hypothetical protein
MYQQQGLASTPDEVMKAERAELNILAPDTDQAEPSTRGFIDDPQRAPVENAGKAGHEDKSRRQGPPE